jgi:hypothetical protein
MNGSDKITPMPPAVMGSTEVAVVDSAIQLSTREKTQIIQALRAGSFEMATSFVFTKAMNSLKSLLNSLGIVFLGELLEKANISEESNIFEVVTDSEAIRLAKELGIVNDTAALKLRHAYELVSNYSQQVHSEDDSEPMEEIDAAVVLSACVKNFLSKENIEVSRDFADFRKRLETKTFS